MVEEDQGAEAEAYPPREVRLVEPGDPCVGAAPRVRQRKMRKSGGSERPISVPGGGGVEEEEVPRVKRRTERLTCCGGSELEARTRAGRERRRNVGLPMG